MNILTMLYYEEDEEKFRSNYTPQCVLPFTKALSLAPFLEFYILDSTGQLLEIADFSQLYISIKTL